MELKSQHKFFEASLKSTRILKRYHDDGLQMLLTRKPRQIYNYTHSAYSETSHLFFGEKVIQSQEGCQQGDPEGPAIFSDTIQDLFTQMVSQYNVWYLDDGNLSGPQTNHC